MTPFAWQVPVIHKQVKILSSGELCTLNYSSTGVGKTVMTLFAAKKLNRPVFVVCPKIVRSAWRETAEAIGVEVIDVVNYEYVTFHKEHDFGIWRRKNFIWNLPPEAILIFDESHKMNGQTSKRSKLLKGARDSNLQSICLSATAADSPLQMKALGYALGLHRYKDFWYWCQDHKCVPGDYGGLIYEGGVEYIKEMRKAFAHCMVGVTHEDLGDKFPKVSYQTVAVNLTKPELVNKAYAESLKEQQLDAEMAITARVRARQRVEYLKTEALKGMADELVEAGHSVVIFVHYDESLNALKQMYPDMPVIQGGQTDAYRQVQIQKFLSDRKRVILVKISAGGTGVGLQDLHGMYPRVALVCPTDSAIEMKQAFGRIPRADSKTPSIIKIVFAAKTVEAKMQAKTQEKLDRIDALNDNDFLTDEEARLNTQEIQNMSQDKNTVGSPEERAHAEFGPSSMKHRMICPHYKSDNSGPVHPVTEQGTKIHDALEHEKYDHLDDEEMELAEMTLGAVEGILEEFSQKDKLLHRVNEKRIRFLQGTEYEQFGTADIVLLGAHHADVVDYKFGYHKVPDAKDNWQGICYALGVFEEHSNLKTVTVWFLQPRCEFITSHTFHREDMEVFAAKLTENIIAARDPETPRNQDDDNCKYCALRGTCVATTGRALGIAKAVTEGMPIEKDLSIPANLVGQDITDPALMGQILTVANFLSEWADSIKKAALDRYVEDGFEPDGYEVKFRRSKRSVKDANFAFETLREFAADVGKEDIEEIIHEFLGCVSVSVPSLEKVVGGMAGRGQKTKLTEQFLNALLDNDALNMGQEYPYLKKTKEDA